MPRLQCPVQGCKRWDSFWGKRSYPLSSPNAFTLQLNAQIDISINNRICSKCWDRHKDHTLRLDGRTRVAPTVSSSPLDTVLSAAINPLLPSPSPSNPPTPARVIAPLPAHSIDSSNPESIRTQSLCSPSAVQVQSKCSPTTLKQSSPLLVVLTPLLPSSTCLLLPPRSPSASGTSSPAPSRASTTSATACRR